MIQNIIYISSFAILIIGSLIISIILSNKFYNRILDQVNRLVDDFDINTIKPRKLNPTYLFIKRSFDIMFSLSALFLLSPLLITITIWIKLDSKGPVIVKFKRIGKNGKPFYAFKFRTMYLKEDITANNVWKIDDPRITRIGKVLRNLAIDELPEFINVINGSMSIIGTTIAREFEYEDISDDYKRIINMYKPGITNLWVVSQDRHKYKYDRRLLYDLYYINNISFFLDFIILFRTLIVALGATGAY